MAAFKRHTRSSLKLALFATVGIGIGCSLTPAHADDTPPAAPEVLMPASSFAPWGFNLSGRDTAIIPGNNFFEYANGTYLKDLTIPSDMTSYGPFNALAELSRQRVQSILNELSAHPVKTPHSTDEKLGTFYASFMNEKAVEKRGISPLKKDLKTLRSLTDAQSFATLSGSAFTSFTTSPFSLSVSPDSKDPTHYSVYLDQGGLGLPDRDYYLKPQFAEQRKAYQAYITQILTFIRWPEPSKTADAVIAFETKLAEAHWARADMRDPNKTYNPMTVSDLIKTAPGFDWKSWMLAAGLPAEGLEASTIIVQEPSAITGEAAVLASTAPELLRSWQAFHTASNAAGYLPDEFVQASFTFHKVLSGQPALPARWKRGVSATNSAMGMALGKVYVEKFFPAEDRAAMEQLTENLKTAFHTRLQHNSWMTPATRQAALTKLDSLEIQVGYPKKWRDYSGLEVNLKDLYGNVKNGIAFEWAYELSHLGKTVDRDEWDMTPQTVNAYNNPLFNEIVFPAAILQPPFFNAKADAAINYGAIGGVIGHEMTHSFDDEGRQFDEHGRLRDWWTKKDTERFQKLAARLGAQYDAFEVLPGVHVNGKLTMGENIADLGGLTLGLDAYHASLNGEKAPVIDGLTGDQRVFLGWAQVWRQKLRENTVKSLVVVDPHSPPEARVNLPMHNIDAWYKAWNVKKGDALYLAPSQRVKIW